MFPKTCLQKTIFGNDNMAKQALLKPSLKIWSRLGAQRSTIGCKPKIYLATCNASETSINFSRETYKCRRKTNLVNPKFFLNIKNSEDNKSCIQYVKNCNIWTSVLNIYHTI